MNRYHRYDSAFDSRHRQWELRSPVERAGADILAICSGTRQPKENPWEQFRGEVAQAISELNELQELIAQGEAAPGEQRGKKTIC